MKSILLIVATCAVVVTLCFAQRKPSTPVWPTEFNTRFLTNVKEYGPSFLKPGRVWYNYNLPALRADYYDWCIPLFDDITSSKWNFTCTFLQHAKTTYFISQPNDIIKQPCCIFETVLPPPTPNWLSETTFNKTEMANGILCDKWWFQRSDDMDLYYGYWDSVTDQTPVRFLGLSTLGVTTLEYYDYKEMTSPKSLFEVPPNCNVECNPAAMKRMKNHMLHPFHVRRL